jgi:hypothetical protein
MARTPRIPDTPETHPKRRYIITPRIVKIDGVNTPENAPNFFAFWLMLAE